MVYLFLNHTTRHRGPGKAKITKQKLTVLWKCQEWDHRGDTGELRRCAWGTAPWRPDIQFNRDESVLPGATRAAAPTAPPGAGAAAGGLPGGVRRLERDPRSPPPRVGAARAPGSTRAALAQRRPQDQTAHPLLWPRRLLCPVTGASGAAPGASRV